MKMDLESEWWLLCKFTRRQCIGLSPVTFKLTEGKYRSFCLRSIYLMAYIIGLWQCNYLTGHVHLKRTLRGTSLRPSPSHVPVTSPAPFRAEASRNRSGGGTAPGELHHNEFYYYQGVVRALFSRPYLFRYIVLPWAATSNSGLIYKEHT